MVCLKQQPWLKQIKHKWNEDKDTHLSWLSSLANISSTSCFNRLFSWSLNKQTNTQSNFMFGMKHVKKTAWNTLIDKFDFEVANSISSLRERHLNASWASDDVFLSLSISLLALFSLQIITLFEKWNTLKKISCQITVSACQCRFFPCVSCLTNQWQV